MVFYWVGPASDVVDKYGFESNIKENDDTCHEMAEDERKPEPFLIHALLGHCLT